jgi:hypothetical protein
MLVVFRIEGVLALEYAQKEMFTPRVHMRSKVKQSGCLWTQKSPYLET